MAADSGSLSGEATPQGRGRSTRRTASGSFAAPSAKTGSSEPASGPLSPDGPSGAGSTAAFASDQRADGNAAGAVQTDANLDTRDPLDLTINENLYRRCVQAFSLLRSRLGVNVKVHGVIDDLGANRLQEGNIFLFNHFARFETIIPQYFVYQETGAFCRCVATADLFAGGGRFAKLLTSLGAVPNNHPGLLPFLASEILRGRKVILFPEGGMIKDRRVVDDNGEFNIFSPTHGGFRKHHKGAAALAVTLAVFKQRILDVHAAGEWARLKRWVNALDLEDEEALLAAARKPTTVIPANITFYPIRGGENLLTKIAHRIGGDVSPRMNEELLIEGNLLLKRTDMDIRFGEPVRPEISWTFWERFVTRKVFQSVDTPEALFALNQTASSMFERAVAASLGRATQ